jgi:phenylalanyl-tRNA synthetase beta chain
LPADIVEEILRIDGWIILISRLPSLLLRRLRKLYAPYLKEKVANYFVGLGFHEMMTNSITNAAYFTEEENSQW